MTSWLQKASILGRWGEGGIRYRLEGDFNFDVNGLEGGVREWYLSSDSYGEVNPGRELRGT